jgi:hypothetical protein
MCGAWRSAPHSPRFRDRGVITEEEFLAKKKQLLEPF